MPRFRFLLTTIHPIPAPRPLYCGAVLSFNAVNGDGKQVEAGDTRTDYMPCQMSYVFYAGRAKRGSPVTGVVTALARSPIGGLSAMIID
jgi:hypothetical protein